MDRLMYLLAPKSWIGFTFRLIVLIAVVAIANVAFANFFDRFEEHEMHSAGYYVLHAAIVGGPLIAFFLAVTVFQISLQKKLSRLSRKDGLTGLNNRRSFFDLVEKVRSHEHKGMLLMLDADRFKNINDIHGHNAGDRCLKSIAYTLNRSVRKGDVLARMGGEEFALYLTGATAETARVIGERLAKPITFKTEAAGNLSVTLSIGAARVYPELSIDALFLRADGALYEAKQNGRAQYTQWEEESVAGPEARSA